MLANVSYDFALLMLYIIVSKEMRGKECDVFLQYFDDFNNTNGNESYVAEVQKIKWFDLFSFLKN